MSDDSRRPERRPRSRRTLTVLGAIALLGAIGFGSLGVWQVERLGWKNALIAAVAERTSAVPVDPSADGTWERFDPEVDEYRRVAISGQFDNLSETLVQAVTAYGGGFWVMTPLALGDGRAVLVNRGFVLPEQRDPGARGSAAPEGIVTVTGLLRQTEPDGGFLRSNDPAGGRWFSRDVAAIGAHDGLDDVAPFFIDADRLAPDAVPIGGLTVISFSNNHLIYAITWFALAAMLLAGFGYVVWDRKRG